MKKMLLATALTCLLQDVFNRRLLFKTNRQQSTKGNHHPSFLRALNWAEETVDAAKICGGAENVVKQKPSKTFVKWIVRFYYFRHLYSAEARVYCSHTG